MRPLKFKPLDQRGFDHVLIVVFVGVMFGIIGSIYLYMTHAASNGVALEVYSFSSGYCMDDYQAGATRIDLYPCNNRTAQAWIIGSGSGFTIKSTQHTNECVTSGGSAFLEGCNGSNYQKWSWTTLHQLKNEANGKCIDDYNGSHAPNTTLDMYNCKNSSQGPANQAWWEHVQSSSSGNGTGGGPSSDSYSSIGQEFINRAEKWTGLPYLEAASAGAHEDGAYTAYKNRCESNGIPVISSSCAMDCSGFVSVVVDDVLRTNYGWIAYDGYLGSGNTSHWHVVSASSAEPGDIAVGNQHVEFVLSRSGSRITTFGEHSSGTHVSSANPGSYTILAIYRWE